MDRALDLREQIRRLGGEASRTSTSLASVDVEVQQSLVQALRGSRFAGDVNFRVLTVDGGPSALRFTSTATGKATNVQKPEESAQSDGFWAYQFIEAWNASARGQDRSS